MEVNKIIQGDCLEVLKTLEENSIDAVVTDPPYGLSFMGKKWDYEVPSVEIWKECLRVLKPGGYLLSFAGTRTQHRMAVNIEDAGFEIRDMIAWVYGSGFPKSLNIGKAVDKLQGNEREEQDITWPDGSKPRKTAGHFSVGENIPRNTTYTKGTSEWEGWGTALKPALEPITVARKPLSESTVAENVLKWGTAGINIDESRVEITDTKNGFRPNSANKQYTPTDSFAGGKITEQHPQGRFPANLILDNSEEVRECFPETKSGDGKSGINLINRHKNTSGAVNINCGESNSAIHFGDSGNASRFFKSIIYQAKSSKSERNKGLDSTLTVKYNSSIIINKKLCQDVNTVAVQLLQKVISEQGLVSFNIDESGVNITAQCQSASLSTTLTTIKKITELKTCNLLTLLLTNESTLGANSEMEVGGNLVESAEKLKKWLLTITNEQTELALGASRVACQMLSLISEEENWKVATNFHSTVKPIALMEYLIKMVTPKGGIVLDPFAGSGSTLIACKKLGRNYIGCELDPEYIKIAEARIKAVQIAYKNYSDTIQVSTGIN